MPIISKTIPEANLAELKDYASRFLNLELAGNETEAKLIAKIKTVQQHENIFVESDDAPPTVQEEAIANPEQNTAAPVPTAPELRASGSLGKDDPKCVINIGMDNREGSSNADVGVAVNGVAWQIKRGVDATVPWRVVEALEAAEEHVIRHVTLPDGDVDVVETYVKRFNLGFPGGKPSKEEIDAWHERTDNIALA